MDHEQQDPMNARTDQLDIELHFCREAAMWDAEFDNVSSFKEAAPFGDATDGQIVDIEAALKSAFG